MIDYPVHVAVFPGAEEKNSRSKFQVTCLLLVDPAGTCSGGRLKKAPGRLCGVERGGEESFDDIVPFRCLPKTG